MSWRDIVGQTRVVDRLRRAFEQGRLTGAYLFVGPHGVGKCTVARKLAQAVLCEGRSDASFEPCGTCPACVQVTARPSPTHPDLEVISRPDDKSNLPIDAFIGDREHRSREGLCHRMALSSTRGRGRIAIIDDADELAEDAANSLLKTLEEPPPRTILILIAGSAHRQLPTIRSRCQIVRFQPLEAADIARLLRMHSESIGADGSLSNEAIERLASMSAGSLRTAGELADTELLRYRDRFIETLGKPCWDPLATAKDVTQFVESVGKETPPRRRRMRQLVAVAADYYRQLARHMVGASIEGDAGLVAAVRHAATRWNRGPLAAVACIDACILAEQQIAANIHLTTFAECWLDALAEHESGERTA
ncbi:MAG: DNA polymerase III subunit delta' [Planctomycetes bacterium]|nr:DNA polymerase III subunit delta' [Planctomycetota bacterium]